MFKQYTLFIKWWIFAILMSVGFMICYYSGITNYIFLTDTTYICSVIFCILCYGTLKSGIGAYTISKHLYDEPYEISNVKKVNDIINYNWFMGNLCSGLGICGTILGLSYMVGDIGKIDPNNIKLEDFSNSMQIALLTTIVGLVCKILIECQNIVIERELENV